MFISLTLLRCINSTHTSEIGLGKHWSTSHTSELWFRERESCIYICSCKMLKKQPTFKWQSLQTLTSYKEMVLCLVDWHYFLHCVCVCVFSSVYTFKVKSRSDFQKRGRCTKRPLKPSLIFWASSYKNCNTK